MHSIMVLIPVFHCCPRAGEGPDQPRTNELEGCAVERQACAALWF